MESETLTSDLLLLWLLLAVRAYFVNDVVKFNYHANVGPITGNKVFSINLSVLFFIYFVVTL